MRPKSWATLKAVVAPPGSVSKPPRTANGAWRGDLCCDVGCVGCFSLLVRHLLFLFPGGHKDGRDYADGGEAARHQPITGNVAEAVDQHRGNGSQSKAEGYNEGNSDGGAGDVFEDE